jgi:MFS family permease
MTQRSESKNIRQVIAASSVGTLIEWYDFYIFGSLATVIADHFFPKTNPTAALLSTLATFAAGFIVRPFGALVFGRLGDLIGRKYTFLLTLILMGGSTFAIGLIPDFTRIGYAAPLLVLLLRLVQGLALGGEYGGAATYVAEHAPPNRRGYYTSWIQTTATIGLFISFGVIILTRHLMASDLATSIQRFNDKGWRIPFLVSILLVIVSIYIRLRMNESPLFAKLKSEGKVSVNPLKESFGHKANLKMVLLALFGATMGQGVVWYTGQFYAQSFMETVCHIEFDQSRTILLWAILFATPFFVVFGGWSDKIGRKWIMLIGMLLAICTYRPIFNGFLSLTQPTGKTEFTEHRKYLGEKTIVKPKSTADSIHLRTWEVHYSDGAVFHEVKQDTLWADPARTALTKTATVYNEKKLDTSTYRKLIGLVFILVLYVTMVYGPIAAFLVEMFPTRIRYTSMSLPYHIGNGVFGGLCPFIATLLTTINPDKLSGLWYPIIIGAVCFIIGTIYVSNRIDANVND